MMNSIYASITTCKGQQQALTLLINKILQGRTCYLKAWHSDLDALFELFMKHVKIEKEVLIPIIREVFSSKEKIGDYMQGEHARFKEKLQKMLSNIDMYKDHIYECLEDLLVYIYQENQLLYPLIEQYLLNTTYLPHSKTV